jgi:hypothetical protein
LRDTTEIRSQTQFPLHVPTPDLQMILPSAERKVPTMGSRKTVMVRDRCAHVERNTLLGREGMTRVRATRP